MTTFLYFAYGSNLLGQRILLQNPTAVRKGIAKLSDYRLDFNRQSKRWGGCSATIVPDAGKHVWGAVWEIEKSQMESLDQQEGVNDHVYAPLQVKVRTPNEEILDCRVYKLIDEPPAYPSADLLPEIRRPSRVYLETILQGAVESKLPDDYFQFLKSFHHNGFSGPVNVPGVAVARWKENSGQQARRARCNSLTGRTYRLLESENEKESKSKPALTRKKK